MSQSLYASLGYCAIGLVAHALGNFVVTQIAALLAMICCLSWLLDQV
jgi:hypothetical protein